jgi:hypothetical protein
MVLSLLELKADTTSQSFYVRNVMKDLKYSGIIDLELEELDIEGTLIDVSVSIWVDYLYQAQKITNEWEHSYPEEEMFTWDIHKVIHPANIQYEEVTKAIKALDYLPEQLSAIARYRAGDYE